MSSLPLASISSCSSIHWCTISLLLSLSMPVFLSKRKKGAKNCCGFCGFRSFFSGQIALLFSPSSSSTPFLTSPMKRDVTAHSLATCLLLFSPSVVHICFSSLLSLCTSGSLRSLQPLRARWTLKAHGTLSECQPTPTPQTPLARTGLLHCTVEPQSLSQWADISKHPNKPDTARWSNDRECHFRSYKCQRVGTLYSSSSPRIYLDEWRNTG